MATGRRNGRGPCRAGGQIGILERVVVLAPPTGSARAPARLPGVWLVLLGRVELVPALARRAALRRSGPCAARAWTAARGLRLTRAG